MSKTRAPLGSVPGCIRNGLQIQSPSILAAHEDRERIIETKRRTDYDIELLGIFALDLIVNRFRIRDRSVMKNLGKGRAGVFGIEIDLTCDQRAVAQVPSQIKTAIDFEVLRFQHLGDDFSEQHRLSEVFR